MRILSLFFIFYFLISCSAKRDPIKTIKVNFSLPQSSHKDFDTSQNPTDVSGFNCVAVFISYPDKANGTCTDSSGVNLATPFDMVGMVTRPGGQLEADVEVGPSRTFHLVGFNADLPSLGGTCPDVKANFSAFEEHLSEPYIIGQVTTDIFPVTSQNISFNSTFDSDKKINDCSGSLFDDIGGSGGGPSLVDFGDGSDGSDTITTGDTYTVDHYFKVNSINSSDPHIITVDGTTLTHFGPGQEVMWYVNEEGATIGCGGGGPSFHPGMYNFNRIVASSGSLITFERPFNEYVGPSGPKENLDIPTNLSNVAGGSDFCGIQIVSVPNYQDLTYNPGGTINVLPFLYGRSSGYGGIRAIKVKGNLTFTGSTTEISAVSKGFPLSVAAPIPSSECQSSLKECLFMGAGGNTSVGGGILIIHADTVDVSAPVNILADGGAGGPGSGGGSVRFRSKNFTRNGNLTISASGGSGGSNGGDGGLATFTYCTEAINSGTLIISADGGTGTTNGAAGTVVNSGPTFYCN